MQSAVISEAPAISEASKNLMEAAQKSDSPRKAKETLQARAERDPAFRKELLREGVCYLLSGDVTVGMMVLHDYIHATVGFPKLGEVMGRSPESLRRMFRPEGNPHASYLFEIIAYLQRNEGVTLSLRANPRAARSRRSA